MPSTPGVPPTWSLALGVVVPMPTSSLWVTRSTSLPLLLTPKSGRQPNYPEVDFAFITMTGGFELPSWLVSASNVSAGPAEAT